MDASGVDVLTLPCMQVILAALKASPGMRIEKPSEAFVEAFADLALDWRQDGQEDAKKAPETKPPRAGRPDQSGRRDGGGIPGGGAAIQRGRR